MNKALVKGEVLIRCLHGTDFIPSKELKAIPGLTFGNNDEHRWYVATLDDRQIACVGMFVRNGVARFKTDAVLPDFRGQGLYSMLFEMRETLAKNMGAERATTFSNKNSRPVYVKNGFIPAGIENESGVLYMTKEFDKRVKSWLK